MSDPLIERPPYHPPATSRRFDDGPRCDVCEGPVEPGTHSTVAYGLETLACRSCRGLEPDDDACPDCGRETHPADLGGRECWQVRETPNERADRLAQGSHGGGR